MVAILFSGAKNETIVCQTKEASRLSESSGLTLRLEKRKDVVSLNGALDVADDRSARLVHELNADLDDTTARAGTAEDLSNLL